MRELVWETKASRVMEPDRFRLVRDGYMGTVSTNDEDVRWEGTLTVSTDGVTFDAERSSWRFEGESRRDGNRRASWSSSFEGVESFGIEEGRPGLLNSLRRRNRDLLRITLGDGTTEKFLLGRPSLESSVDLFNLMLAEADPAEA